MTQRIQDGWPLSTLESAVIWTLLVAFTVFDALVVWVLKGML